MPAEEKKIVRLSGSCVRTVSEVTLLSTTALTESDHLSIASLKDKLAGSNILRELKGSAFGQIQEVASRAVRNWKHEYLKRLLRPLRLINALEDSIEAFGSLDVGFHNDAFSVGSKMFCAAVLSGPRREVVFPQIGKRFALDVGSMIVFDPALTHALLSAGEQVLPDVRSNKVGLDDVTLFLSAELCLTPSVMKRFRLATMEECEAGKVKRADLTSICPRTGLAL